MSPASSTLSFGTRVSYAVGDLGLNVYWQGVGLFLFFFYTDILGIPAWWAGVTILIASLWDAITDVLIAGLADRTQTSMGRYRPYLLLTPPFLALAFCAMFYVPSTLSAGPLIAYALATHLIFRTLYTLYAIPYSSLSVRVALDSASRSRLAGTRMQAAAIGGLTTAMATPSIVARFTEWSGDPGQGWLLAAVLMAVAATTAMWVCFAGTREQAIAETSPVQGGIADDFRTAIAMLRRNGPLVRVFLCITLASLCLAMLSKTIIYWFKYAVGNEAAAGLALIIGPSILILCAPLWAWYSVRRSKRQAWMLGAGITLFGCLLFFALPMQNTLAVYASLAFIGLGTSSFAVMFWSMLPDTVEYDRWISGENHEAKVFGFASFAQKSALGLNAFILGVLLDGVGFVPNVAQSEGTLLGLKSIMSLIPALGALLTLVVLFRYPLDAAEHTRIKDQLRVRDQLPQR
jgi:GPH family glycoside/pentoside/hexuronide:cation symporter